LISTVSGDLGTNVVDVTEIVGGSVDPVDVIRVLMDGTTTIVADDGIQVGQTSTAPDDDPVNVRALDSGLLITELQAQFVEIGGWNPLDAALHDFSNEFSEPLQATNAVDGDPETSWSTARSIFATATWHFAVDLGAVKPVSRIAILPRSGFASLAPKNFSIEASVDGEEWNAVVTESGYVAGEGAWYAATFLETAARFVRLSGTVQPLGDGSYYIQFADVKVSETGSSFPSSKLQLSWPAPTASDGRASHYQVRYNTSPINALDDWIGAVPLSGVPAVRDSGQQTTMLVDPVDLPRETVIYLAVLAFNSDGATVAQSNSVKVTTSPEGASAPILDLAGAVDATDEHVTLSWTSTGDDGFLGTAESYDIRWSMSPIVDETDWSQAIPVDIGIVPAGPGEPETFAVSKGDLPAAVPVYFAIKVANSDGLKPAVANYAEVDMPTTDETELVLHAGWNAVSLAVDDGRDAEALFSGVLDSNVLAWGGTDYVNVSELQAGTSYWIFSSTGGSVRAAGEIAPKNEFMLGTGWNAIGIGKRAGLEKLTMPASATIVIVWHWSNSEQRFHRLDVGAELIPGESYWVYSPVDNHTWVLDIQNPVTGVAREVWAGRSIIARHDAIAEAAPRRLQSVINDNCNDCPGLWTASGPGYLFADPLDLFDASTLPDDGAAHNRFLD
ncbi:MAG: discoidin domain-containing protein, partial [Lentisphaeria bacterium]|nr:discoidin domain-containing protein [Lentisphaeria bacterium]